TSFQGDLARGYLRMGAAYRAAGETKDAEAAYQKSLEILDKLAKSLPDVPQAHADLARAYNDLGVARAEERDENQAKNAYEKSLVQWTKLVRAHPKSLTFALGESTTAFNLGNLMRQHGNPTFAKSYYADAIKAFDAFDPDQRKDAGVKQALRNAHWKCA